MKKIFKGSPKYLELERPMGKSKLDYLILQLDNKCPHRCIYCFIGSNLNKEPTEGNLSPNERKKIIKEASDLGARVVAMPGTGEPLATKEIKELIKWIDKLGMISIIYTKGLLLTQDMTDFLSKYNTTMVVSFDSLDERTAIKLNPDPPGWFPRAMKNIEYARGIFKNFIENRKGYHITRFVINHMVNLINYGQQQKIKDWCGDDILFVCHGPSEEGNAVEIWDKLAGGSKRHQELISYANSISTTKGNTTARADGKCAYYLNGITICDNGDVKTCPASTQTAGTLGNIKDASLEELYNKTQKFLGEIIGGDFPPCLVRDPIYRKVIKKLAL